MPLFLGTVFTHFHKPLTTGVSHTTAAKIEGLPHHVKHNVPLSLILLKKCGVKKYLHPKLFLFYFNLNLCFALQPRQILK
jgi:hypothetical protein